ncbi:MAG: carboxypeptidase-like regulatory domain-containing protein, partial [Clostridium sp.]|nr:carboxypeptidase-like regulatory domain-containing protein [Clostridium sp.]
MKKSRAEFWTHLTVLMIFACAGIFSSRMLSAQTKTDAAQVVKGTVSAGEPMPGPLAGATVTNAKTGKGTVTDNEGKYEIEVTGPQDILQFKFLGFKDVDRIVGLGGIIDVEMEDAYSNLDEIVVVGYGTSRKRDITGSIVSVHKDEIEQKMPTNIFDALQG